MNKVKKYLLAAFFLLGIVQPLYSLGKILLFGKLFDFGLYYQSGQTGNPIVFNFPPSSLFLFLPFSLLPLFSSQIIWTIFSIICLGLSVHLIFKCLDLKLNLWELLFVIPLLALAFPVKWTFGMGQINHLILLLLVATFYLYKKGNEFLSGIFLGLGIILKLTPLYLLILFLVKRKWKIFSFTLITILFFTLLASLFFGFDLTLEYFFKIIPSLFSGAGKEIYYNQSVSSFIARLVADNQWRLYLSLPISLIILGSSYWLSIQKHELTSLNYSHLITASLLANAFSWQHHFVWLIFPFFSVLKEFKKQRNKYLLTILLLSYALIAYNIKNPASLQGNLFAPFILSHVFFGTLILYGLLIYLIKSQAT